VSLEVELDVVGREASSFRRSDIVERAGASGTFSKSIERTIENENHLE
jgi:hypothetical protein